MIVTSFFHNPFSFLGLTKASRTINIDSKTYLSYEDAFWDLLAHEGIAKGSVILLPDFYCNDVAQNIEDHGYKVIYYELDENFQAKYEDIIQKVVDTGAKVLVVLHVLGIESNLVRDLDKFSLFHHLMVVEDSVHRLTLPDELTLTSDSHFLIDSRRKISPFHGSTLYGKKNTLSWKSSFNLISYIKSFLISSLFSFVQFLLTVGHLVHNLKVIGFADKLLDFHDEFIGDSIVPLPSPLFVDSQWQYVNKSDILTKKIRHIDLYEKELWIKNVPRLRIIQYNEKNKKQLRGYPIAVHAQAADRFQESLKNQGIFLFKHLHDNKWSQRRKEVIFFLPAGVQVNETQVKYVCETINKLALTAINS